MENIRQSVNEEVYGMYSIGFQDGTEAMVSLFRELGIINGTMAEALHELLISGEGIRPRVPEAKAARLAEDATIRIMDL